MVWPVTSGLERSSHVVAKEWNTNLGWFGIFSYSPEGRYHPCGALGGQVTGQLLSPNIKSVHFQETSSCPQVDLMTGWPPCQGLLTWTSSLPFFKQKNSAVVPKTSFHRWAWWQEDPPAWVTQQNTGQLLYTYQITTPVYLPT